MELDDIRNLDFEAAMMNRGTKRGRKIKSPTDAPRSGSDRSFVLVRMQDGTIEKHYRKVKIADSGFYTTPPKYSAPRFAAGKSKRNPQYMVPEDETIVGYFRSTATTSGYKTSADLMIEELEKFGLL